jgi:hypothetical protein
MIPQESAAQARSQGNNTRWPPGCWVVTAPGEQDLAPEGDQGHPGHAADVEGEFIDVARLARLGDEQPDSPVEIGPGKEPDVQGGNGWPVLGERRTREVVEGFLDRFPSKSPS